ncbi:hypothetical protein JDM601_0282 [Mycolicibacter sinensis]|uniref:Uncharacterized protein n=1 Tax=Mycolicibacter sinensis (strain JDM601) TaxID=875328 RepID=F5YYW7_MYCSD|nr:hypothetical protein JDM601_0282 [Mycolicibacter sinensis]
MLTTRTVRPIRSRCPADDRMCMTVCRHRCVFKLSRVVLDRR